jgi:lysophospholipase L1-like esterase
MDNPLITFKHQLLAVFFAGTTMLTPSISFAADTLISPDDPGINYYGRFDFSNPKAPCFNWSGTTIEFMISGSVTVGMEFTDGAGYYDIEVDGAPQPTPVYADSWNSKKYVLASALSTSSHIIRIIRRNEPYWTIATLGGIYLSSGGKILPLAKPARKMEFCGDSWTAGYFVEDCSDQQSKTNTNKAWARLTSKAFKAQDIICAESGIGLVKSLGQKTVLPKKYLCTFDTVGGAATPLWNFSSWTPDIVSIFLGINDKSSGATDNEYKTAVHSFVTTIRGNYPNVPILFIAYTGNMDAATRNAVAAETTSIGHKDVHFLECTVPVTGCSGHPTLVESKKISDAVVAKIRQITGWDTTQVSTAYAEKAPVTGRLAKIKAARTDSRTIMVSADRARARYGIFVMSADGRIVDRLQLNSSGTCRWNTAQTQDGLYFIGSKVTGWTRVFIRQ